MTGRARRAADPLERRIEAALDPRRFVSDRACSSFVGDLDDVEAEIAQLIPSEPARAIALYEAFIAGCYEKANEVDDSSGSFGMFVTSLFCGWIRARQAVRADPDETASRLLARMDDDPFGFCYELEKDVARVLDKTGLAALVKRLRARFDAAAATTAAEESAPRNPDWAHRRLGAALRTLYLAQGDFEAYVELAEETGLTAQDCRAVATMLVQRRKPEQALSWVERGLDLDAKAVHGGDGGL
ncbi:MAG: DUF6880 family protein [Actinomycetota bacterium]